MTTFNFVAVFAVDATAATTTVVVLVVVVVKSTSRHERAVAVAKSKIKTQKCFPKKAIRRKKTCEKHGQQHERK